MKAVVAAFNQEKALVGAFSVVTNLRMELFQALLYTDTTIHHAAGHNTNNHHPATPAQILILAPCRRGRDAARLHPRLDAGYPPVLLMLRLRCRHWSTGPGSELFPPRTPGSRSCCYTYATHTRGCGGINLIFEAPFVAEKSLLSAFLLADLLEVGGIA